MTKTLTEQWIDGTIDRSFHYYVRIKGKEETNFDGIDFIDIIRPPLFKDQFDKLMKYNDPEVLAPVPSYEKYVELLEKIAQLEKKLDIAVDALKWYSVYTNAMKGVFNMKPEKEAQEALKQIKEVK